VSRLDVDVAVVGAGAAGLATAIFARRLRPDLTVAVLDGAGKPGAKILVSGGSRCNVTNTVVTERDFNGGSPAVIRRVLRALPVDETIAFFGDLGVAVHEETGGKLFPDSNRAQTVLEALLRGAAEADVSLRAASRVTAIAHEPDGFRIATGAGPLAARAVVLATGGLSLPKTGSDGWGYDAARRLGHSVVPTTPALAPLVLDDLSDRARRLRALSGVSLPARLDVRTHGRRLAHVHGSLLFTHFGVSGPAALDVSRHWLRAHQDGQAPELTIALCPRDTFESLERAFVEAVRATPRRTLQAAVADRVPASIAAAWLEDVGVDPASTLATLSRDDRRALVHALVQHPLPVTDSRGYNYAEVTAGGVALDEIYPGTMASRRCQGLFLVGEILDVDGRIGGFNFQWAWSSARACAAGLAHALR
jgi:predicted Rossmann fold flavoprotein